jgi:hypothetical protein
MRARHRRAIDRNGAAAAREDATARAGDHHSKKSESPRNRASWWRSGRTKIAV